MDRRLPKRRSSLGSTFRVFYRYPVPPVVQEGLRVRSRRRPPPVEPVDGSGDGDPTPETPPGRHRTGHQGSSGVRLL